VTILLWSMDAIRAMAGADYETAVIQERKRYLARFDAKAANFGVVSLEEAKV